MDAAVTKSALQHLQEIQTLAIQGIKDLEGHGRMDMDSDIFDYSDDEYGLKKLRDDVTHVLRTGNEESAKKFLRYKLETALMDGNSIPEIAFFLNHGAKDFLVGKSGAEMFSKLADNNPTNFSEKEQELEVVKLFIENGLDVNEAGYAVTPLALAIVTNKAHLVRLLLDSGADPVKLSEGRTPLEWCYDDDENPPKLCFPDIHAMLQQEIAKRQPAPLSPGM